MTDHNKQMILMLQRYAIVELVFCILLIVESGLLVDSILHHSSLSTMIILIVLIMFSMLMIRWNIQCYRKFCSVHQHIVINTSVQNWAELCLRFGATQIDATTAYDVFTMDQKIKVRMLFLFEETFDKKTYDKHRKYANKYVNEIYPLSRTASMYAAAKRLRINLIVCQSISPELVSMIGKDASVLLNRAEGIINVAVILDQKMVLIPVSKRGLSIIDAKKYIGTVMRINSMFSKNESGADTI